ncbi:LRR receptor-like serine/threonine-protein kinase FLS2-like [Trifolium medium]|uniref:LRR receptor-like serine/threonine-protein kinase FLS2-like n=1 Tax=Trifolium medium TaxID=97028 RepID=A0A392N621_9FABA|nr:LRR receptor-like serine/threonine-protein kinase FLS2-like [Trifolium medium]
MSGELRPSLMKLKSLSHLDLSFNTFKEIPIPKFFGSLANLQYLNLSNAGFVGLIPPHLGNLSHLQSLDLEDNRLHVENLRWVAGLVSLEHLVMNGVDLSLVAETNWILDLGDNFNLTANCSQFFTKGWENIQELDLSFSKLHGPLPSSLGNLTSLTYLDLSYNVIEGVIPSSIGQLCYLNYLDLTENKAGTLPEFLQGIDDCSSRKPLHKLEFFAMSNSQLRGRIPDWVIAKYYQIGTSR